MLTQARLKSLLRYNPHTGHFTWRNDGSGRYMRKGRRAGTIAKSKHHSHIQIVIDGKIYRAHRLAFLYMTGRWPLVSEVDHRDGDSTNNRWRNLRLATHAQNMKNMKQKRAGLKGVIAVGSRFRAMIKLDYKSRHLGYFASEAAAHAAYMAAARKHFGEFARSQ